MLLVVDVGNTNITFGVYRDKELVTTFRLMSKTPRTSDEYGVLITELLSKNHLAIDQIEGIAVASVVPNIMHSLIGGIKRYVNQNVLIIGAGVKTGIRITSENPKEIGPDRIVDVPQKHHAVLAVVSNCCPPLEGRFLTRYSPVRH